MDHGGDEHDGPERVPAWKHEVQLHSRRDAVVALLLVSLAQGVVFRELGIEPPWLPPLVALVVIAGFALAVRVGLDRGDPRIRSGAIFLTAALTVSELVAVVAVVRELVNESSLSGERLLANGAVLWVTNLAVFSLWYYELDSGGPVARARGLVDYPDLLFPQQASKGIADPRWKPRYLDYLYVSFTTSTAFSPTDTMPLSRWSKMVMLVQTLASLALGTLVIARAVNVLR